MRKTQKFIFEFANHNYSHKKDLVVELLSDLKTKQNDYEEMTLRIF